MSMFRRPTEDSSDSDSSSDGIDEGNEIELRSNELSQAGSEEFIGTGLTATETLSSGESISVGSQHEPDTIQNVDHHRNMILASLLEEFYRTRAAELFNASDPSAKYHRQSPEIQPLAQNLFAQASQDLASAGIITPHAAAENLQNARKQYLVGFDNLGLQNLKDQDLLPEAIKRRISIDGVDTALVKAPKSQQQQPRFPNFFDPPMHSLALQAGRMNLLPHPANDLQLSSFSQRRSHYQSSFHETRLLGKGGFGRVYHTYNFFDKREYAVKKIPLSPKLSQRYREYGHEELRHVLREVQALAQLDHCNVVRYHATWIEEPATFDNGGLNQSMKAKQLPNRKLLDIKPAFSSDVHHSQTKISSGQLDPDDGIMFAADSHASKAVRYDLGWSYQPEGPHLEQSSAANSDIFTDGVSRRASQELIADDPQCYVLHVQMTMYPMTLTQYLEVESRIPRHSVPSQTRRHCFHLIPSLKILLGILSGLQYVHTKGLIHRDIKPSNIFLSSFEHGAHGRDPEGFYDVGSCLTCKYQTPYFVNPRIGDFGLVADIALGDGNALESRSDSSDKLVGTQFYHPPKTSRDKKEKSARVIDEKLDVFALGVILVELICPCSTSMERLDLLRSLQEGRLRVDVTDALRSEWPESEIGEMAEELIHGMISADQKARWSCSKVSSVVQDILMRCETSSSC